MSIVISRIEPHVRDLGGGFTVRRLLPSAQRQAVGPFLFFDHFGPITAGPQDDHDVRPHPHIGLSTVTYLFEGAMMHRDSTGVVQRIEPGAVNWMTAGRGIVHSERTPPELRERERRSHGLQLWSAVPVEHERDAPAFQHTPAEALPERELGGARVRVLVGEAFGATSPIRTLSPTVYLDLQLAPGASVELDVAAEERALYGVDAAFTLDDAPAPPHAMLVLAPGSRPRLAAGDQPARVALIGGAPLGHRHLWWNFVASDRALIEAAKDDWAAGRFPSVPGETDFIPLPAAHPKR